jgi:steroid delta-isomerase-like uncharacterized protein
VSEEAKAIVRRFIEETQARGNLEAIDEFIAEDCVNHTPPPGVPPDREGAKQIFAMFRAAFPDHDAVILDMVGEDNTVATYKTFTGTHQSEFMGIPATGKRITVRVMDFVRVRDGKIAEHSNVVDVFGLLAQLGAMPTG